jgi:hypothetical protein
MTKEQYYEMCEMLNQEPIEEHIPIEFVDLHEEVQEAIGVYNMLQDNWDSMNGIYLGKSMAGIYDVFNIMGVEDARSCFFIISILDKTRSEIINSKNKSKKSS